jgi:hypothetical protein
MYYSYEYIYALTTDAAGYVYASGDFFDLSGHTYVARWDGHAWTKVGTGVDQLNSRYTISTLAISDSDYLYAAGAFWDINGENFVSRYYIHTTPTAIDEVSPAAAAIRLYPDPNDGNFQIQLPHDIDRDARLEITNVLGQRVYSSAVDGDIMSIHTTLSAGTYYLRITTSTGSRSAPMLVVR